MTTLKKATVDTLSSALVWNWQDGSERRINLEDFNDEIVQHAALHGLKQKLADSYSGCKTVLQSQQEFQKVLDTLLAGMWNAGRASTGGIWVEALARAAACELEEALEKWNSLDDDEKKDLKKNPQVKQAKAEIELERAKAKAAGTSLDLSEI